MLNGFNSSLLSLLAFKFSKLLGGDMVRVRKTGESIISFMLWPNRSFFAGGQVLLLICAGSLTLLACIVFLLAGAWLIIPFVMLDLIVLFCVLARVDSDCRRSEEVAFAGAQVVVRKWAQGKEWSWSFKRSNLSLLANVDQAGALRCITLCGDGGLVAVGGFLSSDDLCSLLSKFKAHGVRVSAGGLLGILNC